MKRTPNRERARGLCPSALLAFLCAAALLLVGCAKKIPPGKSAVEKVSITGVPKHIDQPLKEGLATQQTETLIGLHVYEYEVFDSLALEKDIQRLERELKRRGYYEARVSAARIIRVKEQLVRVELRVDPGEPVRIRTLETVGLAQLPFEAAEAATNEVKLRVGTLFDEDEFEQAKLNVANALADRGYAYARVKGTAKVDLATRSAHIKLSAEPGRRAKLGAIRIEGLKKIDERPVRRTLQLSEGAVYSRRELRSARSALFGLGVFSRVEVVPLLDHPENESVPVTIQVEESTLRDITLGAGGRLDLLRLAAVGQAGWSHKNFLGGLRKLSITTRPGLTFFATSVDYRKPPTNVFPENFLTVRLEQPGFIEGRTRGYAQSAYNVYPLLYPLPEDTDPRDERVIGYHEVANSLGVKRSFWGRLLSLDLSLNWQANVPFIYQGITPGEKVSTAIDGLEPVVVAYPEFITEVDLRDDPIQPTTGIHLTNSFQTAIPTLGGDLLDVRVRPELATFLPLDQKHRLVLATRVGLGFVFPQNYGEALRESQGGLDYSSPDIIRDQHKLLFRAFYSGGPNSNRGYPYQRVGPQGAIGFLLPEGEDCSDPSPPPTCVRPLGGFSLWETSVELRYRAFESWSFVLFADASDVSYKLHHIAFTEPHVSVGPGVRYLSPVGPIRVDLGFRVPGLQKLEEVATNSDEPPDVSEVAPYSNDTWQNWGQSLALQILIGEAF